MDRPSADDFRPHIGRLIRIDGAPDLTLTEVQEAGDVGLRAEMGLPPGFTILFRGPPQPVIPEGMRTLTGEDGAVFELHLMPIHTPSRDRQDYQAVFG